MRRYSLIRTQQAQRLAEARAQHQRALQQDAEYAISRRDRAHAAAREAAAAGAQRVLMRAQQGFRAHPVPGYIRRVRACAHPQEEEYAHILEGVHGPSQGRLLMRVVPCMAVQG